MAYYRPWLLQWAGARLPNGLSQKLDPSDLVQECLYRAVLHFPQFEGRTSGEFRAWLERINSNELLRMMRFWAAERRDRNREAHLSPEGHAWDEPADALTSIVEKIAREEDCSRVRLVLSWCRAEDRTVLEMRFWHERSHEEIACELGIETAAARQRLFRALQRLCDALRFQERMAEHGFKTLEQDVLGLHHIGGASPARIAEQLEVDPGAGQELDRRGPADTPRDREGRAMISDELTIDGRSEDEPEGRALFDLIDAYWEKLRHGHEPAESGGLSVGRGPSDRSIADYRDVLNLLHRLRRSSATSASRSSAVTCVAPTGTECQLPARASDSETLAGLDRDPSNGPAPGIMGDLADEGNPVPASPASSGERPVDNVEPPRQIGKYVVIEKLDEGGQAQVFRVLHPGLGQDFVLKLGRRPVELEPADRVGLQREGRLLAECDHPNLVRVIDLDFHEGRAYVVMERVRGLNLQQYIEQHRPGPLQAVRLVAGLARTVAYLHAQGIIHQDIKPRNVLIDDRGVPRLIDFGLARLKHAWSDDPDDWTGGTASYQSPEQARGRGDLIGPWTDVFGLGGLFYHLLTGRPLYQGASRESILRQAKEAVHVPARHLNRRVPRTLEWICERALETDPDRRCRSAVEFERALHMFLATHSVGTKTRGLIAVSVLAVLLLIFFKPVAWDAKPDPPNIPAATAPTVELVGLKTGPQSAKPDPPSLPLATASPQVAPKIKSLDGDAYRGDSQDSYGQISSYPGPIVQGDKILVTARLDTSLYCYVIALAPDGKDYHCFPPGIGDSPVQTAEIDSDHLYPLTDGSGLHAFVVVASRNPLPPFKEWQGRAGLRLHWKHVAADEVRGVWEYSDGRVRRPRSASRGDLEKLPQLGPAPFREVCDYLAKRPEFVAIRAIAFAVEPKKSADLAQEPAKKNSEKVATPPGQIVLRGDDARRATELNEAIEASLKADGWDEAIKREEELLALRARVQGPKHFETVSEEWRLKALRRVAPRPYEDRVAYYSTFQDTQQALDLFAGFKPGEAQPLLEKALEVRQRLLTDDHPQTAESYYNLANNFRALLTNYHGTAESYDKLAIHFRQLLAEAHPPATEGYDKLAAELWAQGKYAPAQPFFEKALEIRRRLLTDDHPETAVSYTSTADNLNGQGKYVLAQELLQKSLEIRVRLVGDDQPFTTVGYNYLSINLIYQGKYVEARPLLERTLACLLRFRSHDCEDIAMGYYNLATNLVAQGRYAEAQPLHEKALEIRRRVHTDFHPATAHSYVGLANVLKAQGKVPAAQPLFERAVEIQEHMPMKNHVLTANSYDGLASNLDAQGKFGESQPYLRRALEIRLLNFGDGHPRIAVSYNDLAVNLRAQERYVEAQLFLEKALKIYRGQFDDDHPLTARGYHDMAVNLQAQGKYDEADSLFEQSLSIRRRILTDDHPDTAESYIDLAANRYAQGRYAEAQGLWLSGARSLDTARLRIAFAGLERTGRVKSPRAALAAVLGRLNRPDEAWQALEEDLGRGLLDELAARRDPRLTAAEQDRLLELTVELVRLERLMETTPAGVDKGEHQKQFEDLRHRHKEASIELGGFKAKLDGKYDTSR